MSAFAQSGHRPSAFWCILLGSEPPHVWSMARSLAHAYWHKCEHAAADANGQRLVVLDARTEVDIDATFAPLRSKGVDALLVTTNPFYEGRRDDIVALANRHSVPVLYPWREYSIAGGLISYGTSFTESYRQAGFYVGRVLKGEKPADLPVVQATKFELLVNIETAKSLGLTVPSSILIAADEVIE